MSFDSFKPTIWRSALMEPLEASLVYGSAGVSHSISPTDGNGDEQILTRGDQLKVSHIGNVAIRDYKAGTPITIDTIDATTTTLTVDQAKYFGTKVEDIDAVQAAGVISDPLVRVAAQGLTNELDRYIARTAAKAAAANTIGDLKIINDDPKAAPAGAQSAWKTLVELSTKLTENNVPVEGRWVVVPYSFHAAMLLDDKFSDVDRSGTSEGLRNGKVGFAAGFNIYLSPNVPVDGDKWTILAGIPDAITVAKQINKIEAYRDADSFSDVWRGLMVYGAQSFLPAGLACATVTMVDSAGTAITPKAGGNTVSS